MKVVLTRRQKQIPIGKIDSVVAKLRQEAREKR